MREVFKKLWLLMAATYIIILHACAASSPTSPNRTLPVLDEMPAQPDSTHTSDQRGDILSFYPKAVDQTNTTLELKVYKIECSEPLGFLKGYFTLALTNEGRAALFLLTPKGPVTKLEKYIFSGPDYTLDWGFMYDRNGDGWVDYFTYLDGVLLVKTNANANVIPKHPGAKWGDKISITEEEFQIMLKSYKRVFTHNADDNFDGKSDGVVAALKDPESPGWVYGYGMMRSSSFTQVIDKDWKFLSDIRSPIGPVPRRQNGFDVLFFTEGNPLITSSHLLDLLNKGIRKCRLPKGTLPRD